MKNLRDRIGDLIREISKLKKKVTSQRLTISRLESEDRSSIHGMEVERETQLQEEERRRDGMSDGNLERDLEKQYGTTVWAKKFILEILTKRKRVRKQGASGGG